MHWLSALIEAKKSFKKITAKSVRKHHHHQEILLPYFNIFWRQNFSISQKQKTVCSVHSIEIKSVFFRMQ